MHVLYTKLAPHTLPLLAIDMLSSKIVAICVKMHKNSSRPILSAVKIFRMNSGLCRYTAYADICGASLEKDTWVFRVRSTCSYVG